MISSRSVYHLALLVLVSGAIYFFQLGAAPLWDRDEPRNAGCAAEMLAADDWVVPVFNDQLRTHKPVLLYWLMMFSYTVFGINEFGARFVSAALAVATVLLTYGIGRRLFRPSVGIWAGIIVASTIMFSVAARAATPDSLLMFCGTLALALFVYFSFDPKAKEESSTKPLDPKSSREHRVGRFPQPRWQAVAIYAAMGLGVLAKGPVGLVLPTAVIGMYLLIVRLKSNQAEAGKSVAGESAAVGEADDTNGLPGGLTDGLSVWFRRLLSWARVFYPPHFFRTCWAMRPVTAIVTASVVALPWYLWVAARTNGVWIEEFLWTHNVSRATATMEGHSGPPILFYVGAILVGFFPWSILTIPTGMHLYQKLNTLPSSTHARRAVTFLLCWVGVYVVLFSVAQTKLPSYVTPCYPALAILAGVFVSDWRTASSFQRSWLKVGLGNLIAVGIVLMIALPIAANRFLPGSEWLGVIGVVPLCGGVACWWLYAHERHRPATSILACTAVGFLLLTVGVVPTEIGRHRDYGELFRATATNDGPIASYGHLEPSWIFYGGRPIHDFEVDQKPEFLQFLANNPTALVVTTPARLGRKSTGSEDSQTDSSQEKLFEDFEIVHETDYFLRDRPLLLVRQSSEHRAGSMADGRSLSPTDLRK